MVARAPEQRAAKPARRQALEFLQARHRFDLRSLQVAN